MPCAQHHVGGVIPQVPPVVADALAWATALLVPPTVPSIADRTETVFEVETCCEGMPTLGRVCTAAKGIGVYESGVPAAGMPVGTTAMVTLAVALLGGLIFSSP